MWKVFSRFRAELRWQEPKAFRRGGAAQERRALTLTQRVTIVGITTVLLMLQWWLAAQTPGKNPPAGPIALLLAFAAGGFFAWVVPWMYSLCPVGIILGDKGLSKVVGDSAQTWKYADMLGGRIECECIEDEEVRVLTIQLRDGKKIRLGIAPQVSGQQICEVLRRKGVLLR